MNSFQQMTVASRLQAYIQAVPTTVYQVSKTCGFARGSLEKMLRKAGGLHSDTIAAVLAHYPDLDADWLLLGIGEMRRSIPRQIVATDGFNAPAPKAKVSLTPEEIEGVRALLEKEAEKGKGKKAG